MGDGLRGGVEHARGVNPQLLQHHVGAEQEVAAVRQSSLGDQGGGLAGIGLLVEVLDPTRTALPARTGERPAGLDVTVGNGRLGGAEAERHDVARPGPRRSLANGHQKGRRIADDVVGREDQHHGRGIARCGVQGGNGNGRSRVAPLRLEDDVRLDLRLGGLFGDNEAGISVRDDRGPYEQCCIIEAAEGGLERLALLLEQRNELFRKRFARCRPEPGSRSTTKNKRMNQGFCKNFRFHSSFNLLERKSCEIG